MILRSLRNLAAVLNLAGEVVGAAASRARRGRSGGGRVRTVPVLAIRGHLRPRPRRHDAPAPDAELVTRYCAGMMQQFPMPDGTKADCISDTHAIEANFSRAMRRQADN